MRWVFLYAAVAVVFVAAIVWIAATFGAERATADACWAAGGIPVQGDSVAGDPVVCLDRSVVLP